MTTVAPKRVSAIYGRTGCVVPGCERKHHSKDLCRSHYLRMDRYGLSVKQIKELETADCAICGHTPKVRFVDHDHACCSGDRSCGSCVRGILCQACNLGLGAFRDSPERLEAAAGYLRGCMVR